MKPKIITQIKINGEWSDVPLETAQKVAERTIEQAAANIGYIVTFKDKTA